MNRLIRLVLFCVAFAGNILFYSVCGYWAQMFSGQTPVIDLFYGIIAGIALGLIEMHFFVQLLVRIRFASYQKRSFDYRLWIQLVMLALYYIASISLVRSVEYVHGIFYISVLAVLLTIAWFGWVKCGRILFLGQDTQWFLNDNGRLYKVRSVTENEELVFVVCALNELRDKTVIIKKGTLERIRQQGKSM